MDLVAELTRRHEELVRQRQMLEERIMQMQADYNATNGALVEVETWLRRIAEAAAHQVQAE